MGASAASTAILTLLGERDAGKTICPSEAARRLDPDGWRSRMDEVRRAARELRDAGRVRVTQRGVEVDPVAARGPIRIGPP